MSKESIVLNFPACEECPLCGGSADVEPDRDGYYYDGQEVECSEEDCPATGGIMADPELMYIEWDDMIMKNGEWIPNPEWEKYEKEKL